jgi:branched-chain amino acid aminotransferase
MQEVKQLCRCFCYFFFFTTGNYSKVVPVTRLDDRDLQSGPIAAKAKDLYMDWAHSAGRQDL